MIALKVNELRKISSMVVHHDPTWVMFVGKGHKGECFLVKSEIGKMSNMTENRLAIGP